MRGFEPRHTTSDRQRSLLPSAESIVQCSLVLCLAPVVGVSPSRHFSASAPNIFVWGIPRKIKSKTVSCCKSSQQRYQSSFCTIDCRHHAELQIRMLIWVQDGEQSGSEPWVLQRLASTKVSSQIHMCNPVRDQWHPLGSGIVCFPWDFLWDPWDLAFVCVFTMGSCFPRTNFIIIIGVQ